METLTKENFYNEMKEKYPKIMDEFCVWIDEYKKENKWITLFGAMGDMEGTAPKYHELPIAMQLGILSEFVHYFSSKYEDQVVDFFTEAKSMFQEFFMNAEEIIDNK